MVISIGVEGTYAPQSGRDTLTITGHFTAARRDFELVRELGIKEFRYPIPWHHVERQRSAFDWKFLDQIIPLIYDELGLSIIADPLHHTSYPGWLEDGFLNPHFVSAYKVFVGAFSDRYPMVKRYVPFNEPTCTLDFCGSRAFWHPYTSGDPSYVTMLTNTALAYAEVTHMLRRKNPDVQILHVDTFEHHGALDEASAERAAFLNERRFLFEELVLGKVTPVHPLYVYLRRNGFSETAFAWHHENPVRIDERGGNYYPLNEEQLRYGRTFHAPSMAPRGFAEVATDYAKRLSQPLSLTETNIHGNIADRISWLKYMLEQAEELERRNISLRQFSWYPLFDCAGRHCLLQGHDWRKDPQGIFSCNANWDRVRTELSRHYAGVVAGATSKDLPAYEFDSIHAQTLGGLIPKMNWRWQSPPQEIRRC